MQRLHSSPLPALFYFLLEYLKAEVVEHKKDYI